jgi:hypothetical protein
MTWSSGRAVPAPARGLAARLSALFERDVEIVERLNDAQRRLYNANERLWSGLSPDVFGLIYDGSAPAGASRIHALMADARGAGGPDTGARGAVCAAGDALGDSIWLSRLSGGVRGAPPALFRGG